MNWISISLSICIMVYCNAIIYENYNQSQSCFFCFLSASSYFSLAACFFDSSMKNLIASLYKISLTSKI